jgi:1,4-alpha-glucan branching enzyme
VVEVLDDAEQVAALEPGASVPSAAPPSPTQAAAASQATSCHGVEPPAEVPDSAALAWSRRVFYEVFVRSFRDSDCDGIGNLAGLTSKLDYVNDGNPATTTDLGISGIWLMPIAASPSYHGYDVTDYEAVEPDYGDLKSLAAFLHAAQIAGSASSSTS